jgi:hypothetical protein
MTRIEIPACWEASHCLRYVLPGLAGWSDLRDGIAQRMDKQRINNVGCTMPRFV